MSDTFEFPTYDEWLFNYLDDDDLLFFDEYIEFEWQRQAYILDAFRFVVLGAFDPLFLPLIERMNEFLIWCGELYQRAKSRVSPVDDDNAT